jgi:hypothetical protein
MPLVMLFTRLLRQAHWPQQRQLTSLQVQTQSYSSRPTHGQPLLAQLKLSILWLRVAAVLVLLTAAEAVLVDLKLLQACLLLLALLTL